jgi:glyoxylase-like metal-dependent hydrolase (beta-lactamase superfamily II)
VVRRGNIAARSAIIPDMPPILRVLAPNPGLFTLEGTNTWIVGARPSLVIDPGPDDPEHAREIHREAYPVGAILLTHHHPDHAQGAALLADQTGAPVLAFRPTAVERKLADGAIVPGGGVILHAVHAPGHTPDHLVFFERESGALFTGDAVLGRGTSVIDPPEGDMTAYMRSLSVMVALAPRVIYPGHGPAVWSAVQKLREYVDHRKDRERQVLAGLENGARTAEELVPRIYPEYPEELHPAAARSVLAHLLKLAREGRVARVGRPADERFALASGAACERCGRPVVPGSKLCDRCGVAALQEAPPRTGGGPGGSSNERSEAAADPWLVENRPKAGTRGGDRGGDQGSNEPAGDAQEGSPSETNGGQANT